MLYTIIETGIGREDFQVHRDDCSHHSLYPTISTIFATTARSAAEKFIEQEYSDLDRELGFGTYKIMPCCTTTAEIHAEEEYEIDQNLIEMDREAHEED